jgi:Flp pilus assembly protein TadB
MARVVRRWDDWVDENRSCLALTVGTASSTTICTALQMHGHGIAYAWAPHMHRQMHGQMHGHVICMALQMHRQHGIGTALKMHGHGFANAWAWLWETSF